MTAKEAINKISVMLGVAQEGETAETQVNLAEATLLDGTKVRVDGDFEVGKPLFVITEEGDVYAPEGKHETETGLVISVDADGVITAIEEKEATEEAPAEEEAELEAETSVSLSEEVVSQVMDALNAISENISALETRLNATEEEFHTFRNEPAGKKITNNLNEVQRNEDDLATARFNKLVEFRNQTKK
jgi:hypothetical protein